MLAVDTLVQAACELAIQCVACMCGLGLCDTVTLQMRQDPNILSSVLVPTCRLLVSRWSRPSGTQV
jgi:hypothetical protein